MQKLLSTEAEVEFGRDGVYFPVPVLTTDEAAGYRRCLEQHETKTGKPLQGNWRHKSHLLFTWTDALAHHPKILDAVEDLIGPDVLCWTSNFFIKEPSHPGFVSWHQDATDRGARAGRCGGRLGRLHRSGTQLHHETRGSGKTAAPARQKIARSPRRLCLPAAAGRRSRCSRPTSPAGSGRDADRGARTARVCRG